MCNVGRSVAIPVQLFFYFVIPWNTGEIHHSLGLLFTISGLVTQSRGNLKVLCTFHVLCDLLINTYLIVSLSD